MAKYDSGGIADHGNQENVNLNPTEIAFSHLHCSMVLCMYK